MAKWTALLLSIVFTLSTSAQADNEINTENGWILPTHGTIRVFVIFAEVEYDQNPNLQSFEAWPKGEFPENFTDLFSPTMETYPNGKMTRFFDESSFGTYRVMGDYYPEVITVKQSEMPKGRVSIQGIQRYIGQHITENGFASANGLPIEDFDLWTNNDRYGRKKVNQPDQSLDHVMLILRNFHGIGLSRGFASQGSFGDIANYRSDSYTVFSGSDFQIMRHEYCHLLFGGNNFHCGGGQHNGGGANYFIPLQGGWSCMGNYNSMFMTCNAWDRHRLGWKPGDNEYLISALDAETGSERNTDLSGEPREETIRITLRDFIRTGDAVRIKLPFIPSERYQQWIWLENHQTEVNNGSPFDQFQYAEKECKPLAQPGLYAYLQIDKNKKTGGQAFKGYGDYLKVLPANGFYDVFWEEEQQYTNCVNHAPTEPFIKITGFDNPLSGTSDVEYSVYDKNEDGQIKRGEERIKWLEKRDGEYVSDLPHMGLPAHAFSLSGNAILHMGTNPSTASKLSLPSLDRDIFKQRPPSNRTVHLNGIAIELVKENTDGSLEIELSFANHQIAEDVRWCADTVALHPNNLETPELTIEKDGRISVSRGHTPTRISNPDTFGIGTLFTSATHLVVKSGAKLVIEKKGELALLDDSRLIIEPGAIVEVGKKATLKVGSNAEVIVKEGGVLLFHPKAKRKGKGKKG